MSTNGISRGPDQAPGLQPPQNEAVTQAPKTTTPAAMTETSAAQSVHAAAGTDSIDKLDGAPKKPESREDLKAPIENKYAKTKDSGGFMKWLLKSILKIMWAFGGEKDSVDKIPRLHSKDINPILEKLKPGDIILNGNNGGLSHAAMYVGDGQMVHSMATNKTMRGKGGAIWDAIKDMFGFGPKKDNTGVITEGFGEFLDRFERDTYVVVRQEDLDPAQIQKGVDHLKSLVGRPYDYDFSAGDDSYYCTELVLEYLDAAKGQEHSTVFNTETYDYGIFKTDAIAPNNILEHPSLTPIVASKSAEGKWANLLGDAHLA